MRANRIVVDETRNAVAFIEPQAGAIAPDCWYWCVQVDGGIHADGDDATYSEARRKAQANFNEWKENQ